MERNLIIAVIPLVIGMIILLLAHIPLKLMIHPYLVRMKMLRSAQFIHFATPIAVKDYRVVRASRNESIWASYLVSAIFWAYYLCLISFVVIIVCIAIFESSALQSRAHANFTIKLDNIF